MAIRRYGQIEEVAEAVLFAASERSGYLTGQTICVDGGITTVADLDSD